MDMPTLHILDSITDRNSLEKLDTLAQALGCSTDLFFDAPGQPTTGDTAQLLQMWIAIRSPEGRQAVFACAREVLKAQSV